MNEFYLICTMDKEILKRLGFLDAEAQVYLSLLRLGPCLVSKINQETGLHRTHIYDLLEKLREKGLVSIFIQSGKKHYQAAHPSKILTYLDEKKEQAQSIIPQLTQLMSVEKGDVSIELFKGKEGMKTVLQDILKTGKDYCTMGAIKEFEKTLEFALPSFLKRINKAGIKEKVLCDKKEGIIKIIGGTYRYLDGKYLFPSSVWIYGNKVALFIWSMPYFVIVIESKDVAKTYQQYFEFFWDLGKPF